MRDAIDECYDRLGRYLKPDIGRVPIEMGSGHAYTPYQGRCSRTGIEGPIVDHLKSEVGAVPTHAKLMWMLAYQDRINRSDGRSKPYRLLGHIALLKRDILSTIDFTNPIPHLVVVESGKELVRRLGQDDKYLLLSFGKNADRVLGNGLRYSCGTHLEINGETKFAGIEITNQPIDLAVPLQLAAIGLDWDAAFLYHSLRNRPALTPDEDAKMAEAKTRLGPNGKAMVRLARQVSRQDLRLAKWLSE